MIKGFGIRGKRRIGIEAGIGELLVDMGRLTEEELASLEEKMDREEYGDSYY